ncbi:MAG: hypothetical protein M5U28_09580 [Sandaracinaceae bacterium]|nr:hypothetical protein [Sandaracinaceae bacterium]
MGYRDELEALRARLAAAEHERDAARAEAERLKQALMSRRAAARERTPEQVPGKWRSIPGGEPHPGHPRQRERAQGRGLLAELRGPPAQRRHARPRRARPHADLRGALLARVRRRDGEVLQHTFVRVEAGEPVIVYRDDASG